MYSYLYLFATPVSSTATGTCIYLPEPKMAYSFTSSYAGIDVLPALPCVYCTTPFVAKSHQQLRLTNTTKQTPRSSFTTSTSLPAPLRLPLPLGPRRPRSSPCLCLRHYLNAMCNTLYTLNACTMYVALKTCTTPTPRRLESTKTNHKNHRRLLPHSASLCTHAGP